MPFGGSALYLYNRNFHMIYLPPGHSHSHLINYVLTHLFVYCLAPPLEWQLHEWRDRMAAPIYIPTNNVLGFPLKAVVLVGVEWGGWWFVFICIP